MDQSNQNKGIFESNVEVLEKTTETTQDKLVENEKAEVTVQKAPPANESYLNSFKDMTIADLKREEEEKFKAERDRLIQEQFEKELKEKTKVKQEKVQKTAKEESKNVIEKPNYDLIEENKKIVKLSKKTHEKSKKKTAGIVLACVLGASAVVCVANTIVIDQMSSNYVQIDETYQFNLAKYLKDIYNLDVTKDSMQVIETYPDELLDAGDVGESSNWFDRICNFIVGIFGG